MPVVVRSEAQFCSSLIIGIEGLNPDEFMDVVRFADSAFCHELFIRSEEFYRARMIYKLQKRGTLESIWAVASQKEVEISVRRPVVLRILVA